MKVGVDGVLLGVWASVESASRILDIGTGSGLIALILAQRSPASISAIDIEENAIIQASENIQNSPWSDRIKTELISLQDFVESKKHSFDLIISNPPYFVNSLKNPNQNRSTARHTDSLTHEELIENAVRLLSPMGRICIILPVNEGLQCLEFAESIGLYCTKKTTVFPKPNAPSKRLLLEFQLVPSITALSELTIETNIRHHYSPEFSALTKDFYMK